MSATEQEKDDSLNPARGLLFALAFATPFWAGFLAWWLS